MSRNTLCLSAFFPVRALGSGFSLSGRPLGYNRVMIIAGSADFFCRKTRVILIGGVKNSTKMLGPLWALLICEECLVVPYETRQYVRRVQKLVKNAWFPMGSAHL